jgi:hypothetical protein
MAPERRTQTWLLVALVVVLGVVTYRVWPTPSAPPAAASNGRGAASGSPVARVEPSARPRAERPADPFDVHLSALEEERPKPEPADRNLFRFKQKPAPPPPPPPPMTNATLPPGPTGPPPPPPIALKFIGYAEPRGQPKIAWLVDALGHVIEGQEGMVIEGRYKILRIGVESLDIAYLDGTGRRTIRLTGQ